MMQQTNVDGVTVARGAIGNPWIFAQARALVAGRSLPPPPTLGEQAEVMREHYSLCEATYSKSRAPLLMRKFCIKYSQSHPDHTVVRKAMTAIRSREELEEVLATHYAEDRVGRYVPPEIHGSQAEC